MKKIKLTKMELAQLSLGKNELSKLKGGYGDVDNNNSVSGCNCDYNNRGITSNTNTVSGCTCTCV